MKRIYLPHGLKRAFVVLSEMKLDNEGFAPGDAERAEKVTDHVNKLAIEAYSHSYTPSGELGKNPSGGPRPTLPHMIREIWGPAGHIRKSVKSKKHQAGIESGLNIGIAYISDAIFQMKFGQRYTPKEKIYQSDWLHTLIAVSVAAAIYPILKMPKSLAFSVLNRVGAKKDALKILRSNKNQVKFGRSVFKSLIKNNKDFIKSLK